MMIAKFCYFLCGLLDDYQTRSPLGLVRGVSNKKCFRVGRWAADGIDVVTWAWYRYKMCSSIWWRSFGWAQWNSRGRVIKAVCWGDWNQIVGVAGTFFWIKRVWFACLLPHLLLLLTSQIHFSHSSLSSSTPFQRQFHEYHAASFFIPISSFPPLLEGSIYTCSSSSKSFFSFLSSIIGIAASV